MSTTGTVRERLETFVTTYDNPEISAMAAICRLLEELPDDAARLRVMRWAFGKFHEDFKRPALATVTAAVAATAAPAIAPPEPLSIEPPDFGRQVAELQDMFSDRPDGIRLATPAPR